MSNKHILIVEDEQKIASLIRDYLEKSNYRVTIIGRGDQAVAQIRKSSPDLILLDIMLPGMDGMAVCREVRKFSNIPIIMITAKVEEIDRLLGLEIGADDYICKPFSPREVVARVKAVLRRANTESAELDGINSVSSSISLGNIEVDQVNHQAKANGKELDLTPSEFRLLQVLIAQPGRVFSRDELLAKVQGYDFEGYDRTIDSHIKNLRKKIALYLPDRDVIVTVYGLGYKSFL